MSTNEDGIRHAAVRRIADAAKPIIAVTCPIYGESRRPHPFLVGSGVLMRVGQVEIVITAAHVMAAAVRTHPYLGVGGQVNDFRCKYFSTRSPVDRLDLAVCFLAPGVAGSAPDEDFASPEDVFRVPVTVKRATHLLVGYPHTKQPKALEGNVYAAHPMIHACHSLRPEEHLALGYDPLLSVLVEFEKKRVWQLAGRATAPDPHGVSGGGLWIVPDLFEQIPTPPKLAAIAIEWHRGTRGRILTTRVQPAIALIARELPEYRNEFLPLLQ